jgi:G3E family GTPase
MGVVPAGASRSTIPVDLLTGFLGSGKTTLLQRMLRSDELARTVVLINEFGEIGLDHLLVERTDESVVLLRSGCVCCSIRGDLQAALRDLLARRERGRIAPFDRVLIETTGIADPTPILFTLRQDTVIRHHFRAGAVVTTVDAVNADLHMSANPEGAKQVAAADTVVLTKTDLVDDSVVRRVGALVSRINPGAAVVDGVGGSVDPVRLLDPRTNRPPAGGHPRFVPPEPAVASSPGRTAATADGHAGVASVAWAVERPLDWSAFGVWLSWLLHVHGRNVLRVKGIVAVEGSDAPVFLNAVQHLVHPPTHLDRWPDDERRSRLVFIARDLDLSLARRSLEAFCRTDVVLDCPGG